MYPYAVFLLAGCLFAASGPEIQVVSKPDSKGVNPHHVGSRAPLRATPFLALPLNSFEPGGWLRKSLELQRDGLVGNLGKISSWLTKDGNAWLRTDGTGNFGWEEVPYWLRGYARIGYALRDPAMLAEAKIWIEGALRSQRPNGDFGPVQKNNKGQRDLWAQMLMLQVLQQFYEYSGDARVLPFMTRYFQWQAYLADDQFLETYWEKLRGGDNLASVYWLYNRTGDRFLLDLATKIDRNTANWRMKDTLPDWHVVNNTECFREPATYYLQSGAASDLEATYANFRVIREMYGQVPGGLFGADEIARPGHTDPHQAAELCSMVEQIQSDGMVLNISGDPAWAENAEDVAFNTMPAALTADYRALRYLTAPNMVVSDARNHAPGVHNKGPFFLMNPFSSRCCQHNHSSAWVNYLEWSWTATPDLGLAAQLYSEGSVTAKAGAEGVPVTLKTTTRYPFEETVEIVVESPKAAVEFPLYLRIPSWAEGAAVSVNGKALKTVSRGATGYFRITNKWKAGDRISLRLPMGLHIRQWAKNKNSISVDYGPLTFSLKIDQEYVKQDSAKTAISDSKWQKGADAAAWPSFEILPKSPWNYGLLVDPAKPASALQVVRGKWPANNYPFAYGAAPIEIRAKGKRISAWTLDENGMAGVLPQSPVATDQPAEAVTLVPMGAAHLRISSFPVVQ